MGSGIENTINFCQGQRLEPSQAEDIHRMQKTSTSISDINHTGNPEGVVSANPGSLCRDPVSGSMYKKNTGTGNTGWSQLPGSIFSINVQTFTTSGTYTPTANMQFCKSEVVGGGAAGCGIGGTVAGQAACGPGGGAGGYGIGIFTASDIGASKAVTIGAGGVGVASLAAGASGGSTSLGSLISANGGSGQTYGSPTSIFAAEGGAGATAGSGGYINAPGQNGGSAFWYLQGASAAMLVAGGGGNTLYGAGGLSRSSGERTAIAGRNGIGYGSGGGGALGGLSGSSVTSAAGGNGAGGIVIITEFLG